MNLLVDSLLGSKLTVPRVSDGRIIEKLLDLDGTAHRMYYVVNFLIILLFIMFMDHGTKGLTVQHNIVCNSKVYGLILLDKATSKVWDQKVLRELCKSEGKERAINTIRKTI